MKKILPAIILLAVSASVFSCVQMITIRGNGVKAEKIVAFNTQYRELSVSGGIKVLISPTIDGRVQIVADEQVMEYVTFSESGGKVKICYSSGVIVRSKIETVVTLPVSAMVSGLRVSSSSELRADSGILTREDLTIECSSSARIDMRAESPRVNINISSAARCNMELNCGTCNVTASSSGQFTGRITARELSAGISSSGSCKVEGSCDKLDIDASSSGSFNGAELRAGKVFVNGSSAASVNVWAEDELGVNISSAATVSYKGAPSMTSHDISSGATLKKID